MKRSVSVACLMMAGVLFAGKTPVMVSLVTPVQVPSCDYDVTGLRLSLIYGECREFTGLDIGIVDYTAKDFTGIAIGGVNIAGGQLYGGQIGLVNWNSNGATEWARRSSGAQIGLLNYGNTFTGLQEGVANIANGTFMGLQSGFLNCAHNVSGLQCGYWFLLGVNMASGNLRGGQIGLVNYANKVEAGLQIGLINIIERNGWAPVLPIVNGHF